MMRILLESPSLCSGDKVREARKAAALTVSLCVVGRRQAPCFPGQAFSA